MHDAIGFYCCHVTMFRNLIGTATLSGNRSNSVNSRTLPGRFSYDLGNEARVSLDKRARLVLY